MNFDWEQVAAAKPWHSIDGNVSGSGSALTDATFELGLRPCSTGASRPTHAFKQFAASFVGGLAIAATLATRRS